nr:Chain A, Nuclear Localization Signal from Endonuclease 8-like 3 [Homo sapiens]
PAHKKPKT